MQYFQNPYLSWIKRVSLLGKGFLYGCKEVKNKVGDGKKQVMLE